MKKTISLIAGALSLAVNSEYPIEAEMRVEIPQILNWPEELRTRAAR
jgi:hypothetical protein